MSGSRGGDERKVSSLRELSPAIEPARDLWPQIEARIDEERRTAPGAMAAQPRPARARAGPRRWRGAGGLARGRGRGGECRGGRLDRKESPAGYPPRGGR